MRGNPCSIPPALKPQQPVASAIARFRLLPLAGWQTVLAKDAARRAGTQTLLAACPGARTLNPRKLVEVRRNKEYARLENEGFLRTARLSREANPTIHILDKTCGFGGMRGNVCDLLRGALVEEDLHQPNEGAFARLWIAKCKTAFTSSGVTSKTSVISPADIPASRYSNTA